ncbi:MAG: hypothetical protein CENE_00460 [Candidatus Celerinatantimonas neptuna]|nr:MAG: hypothetical protein CENE_00460 [Candidatus Celerinatantimonas neptuna]
MNDVNSALSQLARVREQMNHTSEQEMPFIAENSEHLQAVKRLISHLCLMCKGVDRALDNRLAELRQQLEKETDIKSLDEQCKQADIVVRQHHRQIENNLLKLQAMIPASCEKLRQINGLPPKLRQQLREFSEKPAPYSYSDNLKRLSETLEFYYQALTNKPGGITPLRTQSSQPSPKRSLLDNQQHQRICDELQRLISEIDFHNQSLEQLHKIRSQILDGIPPEILPAICQQVIQFMIEGMREERKTTQEYLLSLNQDLGQIDKLFDSSLEITKNIQHSAAIQNKVLKRQVMNLDTEIKTVENLGYAKQLVHQRVMQIENLFQSNEKLENQVDELLNRLSHMENQLEKIKKQSTRQEQQVNSQKKQLFIDSLTQIYNRCALDERMELEYKRWKRYGYDLGIAIIDLDHFRIINKKFGQLAGDKALKVIARALQSSLRDTDFLARFGGEEFVVLMPNINADDLILPLDHLREHISSLPFRFKQQQVTITISIGATLFRDNDRLLDTFERADQALYEAKNRGCNVTNIIL